MKPFAKLAAFLAVLSGSILIHEVGHYVTMRLFGITVVRFTVGFGPTLWSGILPDGVEFALKPIILGGYTESVPEGPGSIEEASDAAKYAVAFSGTAVNAFTAFVLLVALGYGGVVGPSRKDAHLLRHVSPAARPFAAAVLMAFGTWLLGPLIIARDYACDLFGVTRDRESRQWQFEKGETRAARAAISLLALMIGINVSLAAFNMLPFRPLDGGAAASLAVGQFLGTEARDAFDRWSMLALLSLVLLKWSVEMFRGKPS